MIKEINEEWNSFTRYQKIVLSIYWIISFPFQPLFIWMIPLAKWIATGKGMPYKRITLIEFLPMSMAMSVIGYLICLLVYCNQ